MRGYVLTCGPLTVPLCGAHVHEALARVEHLAAPARLSPGDPAACSLCSCPPE
jgi:hypothetical protein